MLRFVDENLAFAYRCMIAFYYAGCEVFIAMLLYATRDYTRLVHRFL